MPHVSKRKMPPSVEGAIEKHMLDFLEVMSPQTRRTMFSELLTRTERIMLAKRLSILFLITRGQPTLAISEMLRISPSTVARFELAVRRDNYPHITRWCDKHRTAKEAMRLVEEFVGIFFESYSKSLNQILKEQERKKKKFIRQ